MRKIAIGADIGGSHISSYAVDITSGEILDSSMSKKHIDSMGDALSIVDAWAECIAQTIDKVSCQVQGVGFAMPGPFNYPKGISKIHGVCKFEHIFGLDVTNTLRARLSSYGVDSIRYMNDAGAFAAGEAWKGEGEGYSRLFVATLGTGFGSAFVVDGEPVSEGEGVPYDGCVYYFPFKGTIADDMFSTRWFCRRYKELTGVSIKGAKDVIDNIGKVDAASLIMKEYGENMAEFLSPILKDFKAEAFVMGGNIANAMPYFEKYLLDGLRERGIDLPVKLSSLMEKSAILGAAHLFVEKK